MPAIVRWPGKVPAGKVENGIISGMDWFPTFVAAAGNPNIKEELLKGEKIGDMTYKKHLDGYDQTGHDHRQRAVESPRDLLLRESTLAAVRIDDFKYRFIQQPSGWIGVKVHVDAPILTNLRLDPFERTGWRDGEQRNAMSISTGSSTSSGASCSSSRKWGSSPGRRSSTRPCRRARASTSKP